MDLYFSPEKLSRVFDEYSGSALLLVPPKRIERAYYYCDTKFNIDCILDMYSENLKRIGVCLLSGKEYRFYTINITLVGYETILLKTSYERQMKGHNKGGSSSARFGRIKQNDHHRYVKEVADEIIKYYMKDNNTIYLVDELVIAGPTDLKKEIIETDIINRYFKDRVLKTVNTDVIDDTTITKIIESTPEIAKSNSVKYEKELNEILRIQPDLLVFTKEQIKTEIEIGSLKKVFIKTDMMKEFDEYRNDKCKFIPISTDFLNIYGGIIGIKWYINDYENDEF